MNGLGCQIDIILELSRTVARRLVLRLKSNSGYVIDSWAVILSTLMIIVIVVTIILLMH